MSGRRVAVTGADGFVGRHLVLDLLKAGEKPLALARRDVTIAGLDCVNDFDMFEPARLERQLEGCEIVIHAAGIAHGKAASVQTYEQVNMQGCLNVAEATRRVAARRFVFLSSVRAQSGPSADTLLDEAQAPQPIDPYGRSKLHAEQALSRLDLDWIALRPVLIYGTGVGGHMRQLMSLAASAWPLPLGGLTARRSMISVDNLLGAVRLAMNVPLSSQRVFLVADDEALAVPEMIAAMRHGLGRKPGLFAVPRPLLRLAASVLGQSHAFDRLDKPLTVSTAAFRALGWRSERTARDALQRLLMEDRSSKAEGIRQP